MKRTRLSMPVNLHDIFRVPAVSFPGGTIISRPFSKNIHWPSFCQKSRLKKIKQSRLLYYSCTHLVQVQLVWSYIPLNAIWKGVLQASVPYISNHRRQGARYGFRGKQKLPLRSSRISYKSNGNDVRRRQCLELEGR